MKTENIAYINTIETNFKAEVVVSSLIEKGLDADKILIVRNKGDKRGVSKDIDKTTIHYSGFDMMDYLYVYANREGIYDTLPEGLFYHPIHSGRPKTREDIVREIRENRDDETIIRKFFQPFEIAIDKILVEAQIYEQKYDKAHFYKNLTDILKEQWHVLKLLSTGQALLFIKILPVIAEVSKDLNLIAQVMSIILDCPVVLSESTKSKQEPISVEKTKLDLWKLGLNAVIGQRIEHENRDLLLSIGPLSLNQMKMFEFNNKNDLILKELIDMMIPFDRHVVVRYQPEKGTTHFQLSGKGHIAYLGINTSL